MNLLWRLLIEEDGPTAVEYAVMLAMIVGSIVAAGLLVGEQVNHMSETAVDGLNSSLNNGN